LGVAVSALALVLAFWRIDLAHGLKLTPRARPAELASALVGVRGGWLLVFAAFNVSTLAIRAVQLRALVRRRDGSLPRLWACYQAVAVGMMAQNLLPARLSEAARVVALTHADAVGPAAATGAVVFGRVLDLLALLIITCIPFALWPRDLPVANAQAMRAIVIAGAIVAALLVALLIVFYRRRAWLVERAHRVRPWLAHAVGGFAEGLSAIGDRRRLALAALSSLAIPLTLALTYGSALRAFSLECLPAGTTLLLVAAVLCAIAVPSAPSSLGVYHAVTTWTLTSLGAPVAAAAAFALVTHAIGVVSFVSLGGVALVQLGGRRLWRQA
jgi:uncharacterized protein (TIRG00374 family)